MRIGFMGTPDFAVSALDRLIQTGHNIICVYTRPPAPSGRGQKLKKSPVHLLAEQHNIPVFTPKSVRSDEALEAFKSHNLDLAVVAAYGLILPAAILDTPRLGCINIHASLLPRWRGAAPIHHAILAGDDETGITTMQMDPGLDTGPMLMRESLPITSSTTSATLLDEMAELGGRLIVKTIANLDTITPEVQDDNLATYAAKITKEDSIIDWSESAQAIERKVRALTPWPGASFDFKGELFKIRQASVVESPSGKQPGTLIEAPMVIQCGKGALQINMIQRQGKAPMPATELLRGFEIPVGTTFTS